MLFRSERLAESLDAIFARRLNPRHNVDAVEPKLFGIGSESYVAGSHEFYLGYAVSRGKLLTLDAGHYHPTEGIADKISAVLQFLPEIALHVSRGVRWDSDHVVILSDDVRSLFLEIARGNAFDLRHLLEYPPAPREIRGAGIGESEPARGAQEEPRAEMRFELGDPPAHRRKWDAKLARGSRKAARLNDRHQNRHGRETVHQLFQNLKIISPNVGNYTNHVKPLGSRPPANSSRNRMGEHR